MGTSRLALARRVFDAFETGDRDALEPLIAEDFRFYSPPDPGLDRGQYFERCWPNAELIESFEFVRLFEIGDEVVVTYESLKTGGSRFRNTEILFFVVVYERRGWLGLSSAYRARRRLVAVPRGPGTVRPTGIPAADGCPHCRCSGRPRRSDYERSPHRRCQRMV